MIALQDILPASEAFRSGTLEMALSGQADVLQYRTPWTGIETNAVLTAATVLLFLVILSDLYHLLPHLSGCIQRWRANITLEHSIQLSRDRNLACLACALAFCLLCDRYGICNPDFHEAVAPLWRLPVTLGLASAFFLLRSLMSALLRRGRISAEYWKAAFHSFRNYFILTVLLILPTAGLLHLFGASDSVFRAVLTAEAAAGWGLAMVRKFQILSATCSFLFSFLYLCALEFIPAALIIVSITVF